MNFARSARKNQECLTLLRRRPLQLRHELVTLRLYGSKAFCLTSLSTRVVSVVVRVSVLLSTVSFTTRIAAIATAGCGLPTSGFTFTEWWAAGLHPITEWGPEAHTLCPPSLSETGEAYTFTE